MIPFTYPDEPHVRRHGPGGYRSYESYRPWLRDEFVFRCVYCLKREQWGVTRGTYHIDHFRPQAHYPDVVLHYDNLLYACANCNLAKGKQTIPDPCDCMLNGNVVVTEDGTLEGITAEAAKLIRVLGLNDAEYREFRMLLIGIVQLAVEHDPAQFSNLMRYPDNLPNLASLRPPQNYRPDGIIQSFRARRDRGELPETY